MTCVEPPRKIDFPRFITIQKCPMFLYRSKDKIFGIFRRGGFSSRVKFIDHFKEEIQIRNDNKQNKIIIFLIIVYKSIRHINKILKNL